MVLLSLMEGLGLVFTPHSCQLLLHNLQTFVTLVLACDSPMHSDTIQFFLVFQGLLLKLSTNVRVSPSQQSMVCTLYMQLFIQVTF